MRLHLTLREFTTEVPGKQIFSFNSPIQNEFATPLLLPSPAHVKYCFLTNFSGPGHISVLTQNNFLQGSIRAGDGNV